MKKTSLLMFTFLVGFGLTSFTSEQHGSSDESFLSSSVEITHKPEVLSSDGDLVLNNSSVDDGPTSIVEESKLESLKKKAQHAWTWTKNKTYLSALVAAPAATVAVGVDSALRMKNGQLPVLDVEDSDARFDGRLDKDLKGSAGLTLFNKALSVKYWRAGLVGLAAYGIKQQGFKGMFTSMGPKINALFGKTIFKAVTTV